MTGKKYTAANPRNFIGIMTPSARFHPPVFGARVVVVVFLVILVRIILCRLPPGSPQLVLPIPERLFAYRYDFCLIVAPHGFAAGARVIASSVDGVAMLM